MLAALFGNRDLGLVLLQDPDDPFFRKPIAFHALALVMDQSELQTGLGTRGKARLYTRYLSHPVKESRYD